MTSQRPYLLRALHEWIGDNGLTPHLLVNARHAGVHVPPHTVKDGKVVLNIAERAVHMLSLGNEYITFSARFGGVSHEVFVPIGAVLAIYARENGHGMALPEEEAETAPGGDEEGVDAAAPEDEGRPVLTSVADAGQPSGDAGDGEDEPPPDRPPASPRRGHLRVVK
ncbi:ClpXP protease specificity-enhancing factor [Solilutibacter pythonis]